ncbi:NifX-associated nitrogen fixation protein [Afifella marina]|uniref:Probable nitrogen fixation protein n=1 Tax=Afifella marina DSM 2698 TaxID=1120955 RepID=A0A1G5N677_AFIMA|nr:NifX-associated nitrogen fixation protein [Afifella marina]MBK1622484.1 hypothetical protein [Afifella marina DSM 2698]MBK1626801.1 hypothetical protein [Afifella marina]MBK5919269.1 hypothetical protein [Afifella marina]RAI21309.1 hypothetical protein CH311_07495 [Afifella marina DSM 2698]SCZ32418.1 probable nitrogen fixation protein [Afifella marina DSM 2698]
MAETLMSAAEADDKAMGSPFMKSLVAIYRAEDSYGAWESKSDAELLEEFIVTAEERRAKPIIDDPDPDLLDRVDKFYRAIGLTVERETGLMASPMMSMHWEGFGRVILTAGKLVIFAKSLRDVHRFGFESLGDLAEAGMKVVRQARETIDTYPEVARA